MVAPLHGFMEDLVITVIAEVFIMLSLKHSVKCKTTLKKKHNCPLAFSLWLINHRGMRFSCKFSVSPYCGEKRLFKLFSFYNAV